MRLHGGLEALLSESRQLLRQIRDMLPLILEDFCHDPLDGNVLAEGLVQGPYVRGKEPQALFLLPL